MRKLFIFFYVPIFLILIFAPSCPHKKSPEYYYVEGEMEFEKANFKEAYKYFNIALKIKPDFYDAVYRMALLKVEMDSLKSAMCNFNYAIQLKPTGDGYYQRGCVEWTLRDSIGACRDWDEACALQNNRACDLLREYCRK